MKVNNAFLQALQKGLNPHCLITEPADCLPYSQDTSRYQAMPEAVVFAKTTAEVQHVVRCCYDYHMPLTTRGGGTGTPGGAVPLHGGVVLSLAKMVKILAADFTSGYLKVEAGILHQTVQIAAAKENFCFAPDPGSSASCTIGGNIACNAAGPRAVKYGTTREHILGLTAVTGTGDIIHTGAYTTKSAVGYDLTRLLIGSEGTLAIVTEAILKLTPLSKFRSSIQAVYADLETTLQAVHHILSQPVLPCALEFLDTSCLTLMHYAHPAARYMLLIDIDDEKAKKNMIAALQNKGLVELLTADTPAAIDKLWTARKGLSPALRTLSPYKINEDVVVPLSRIADLLFGVEKIAAKYNIPIVNFGHIGNGNIHVNLLTQTADEAVSELFDLVISLNGTLSGEHGIGISKKAYIPRVIDVPTLSVMKKIKKIFDPKSILNPGKIFPDEHEGKP